MTTTETQPAVRGSEHQDPTKSISAGNFAKLLERCARGEIVEEKKLGAVKLIMQGVLERILPPHAESVLSPDEQKAAEAARQTFRQELKDALRGQIIEILRASPSPVFETVTSQETPPAHVQEALAVSSWTKRFAAEIHVALQADLAPLPSANFDVVDPLGFTNREEESTLLKRGDDIGALQLAFNTLETLCREHDPDKIGVGAVEKGLRESAHGSDRISKLGSQLFKVLRNELWHDSGDFALGLPTEQIHLALSYLISRAGGRGQLEDLHNPLIDGKGYDGFYKTLLSSEFEERISEVSHSVIPDDYVQELAKAGKLPEFAASLHLDPSNPAELTLLKTLLHPEDHVPIEAFCDFRISKALEFVRAEAAQVLARAGVTLNAQEDPLAALRSKRGQAALGDNPQRVAAWQEIIKVLLAAEKSGGYFQGNPTEADKCAAACETSYQEFYGDRRPEGGRTPRTKALLAESRFVVQTCSLLASSLKALSPVADLKTPTDPLEGLRKNILQHLSEGPQSASVPFLRYALMMERLFKERAAELNSSWSDGVPSGVAPAQHARGLVFSSPEVLKNFEKLGVAPDALPKISKLVEALFFSLRNSWAHSAEHRPRPAHVSELLQSSALLSSLTDVAFGKGLPPHSHRTSWQLSDLAEAASLHPLVLNLLSEPMVGSVNHTEACQRLERCIASLVEASNSATVQSKSDAYFRESACELKEGLDAILHTKILPDSSTTAGVLARASLLSSMLRLTKVPEDTLSFPLWQVYCSPQAHQ